MLCHKNDRFACSWAIPLEHILRSQCDACPTICKVGIPLHAWWMESSRTAHQNVANIWYECNLDNTYLPKSTSNHLNFPYCHCAMNHFRNKLSNVLRELEEHMKQLEFDYEDLIHIANHSHYSLWIPLLTTWSFFRTGSTLLLFWLSLFILASIL